MTLRTGLTAEEAALVAVGLEQFSSMEQALLPRYPQQYAQQRPIPNTNDKDYQQLILKNEQQYKEHEQQYNDRQELILKAEQITEALQDEIMIAYNSRYKKEYSEITSSIVIAYWDIDDEYDAPYTDRTKITKSSLAEWFYQRDYIETAMRFDKSVVDQLEKPDEHLNPKGSHPQHEPKLSNEEITKLEKRISDLEALTSELRSLVMEGNTKEMKAMILAQHKFWLKHDPNKLPTQKAISNYIADILGKDKKDRMTDELARAIQPDHIIR